MKKTTQNRGSNVRYFSGKAIQLKYKVQTIMLGVILFCSGNLFALQDAFTPYWPLYQTPPSGCQINCNSDNIAITEDCTAMLIATDYFTVPPDCTTESFRIELLKMDMTVLESGVGSVLADGIANSGQPYSMINQYYIIRITEIGVVPANSCMSTHQFQYKIAPVIECAGADTVPCYFPRALYSLEGLTNCAGPLFAHVIDSTFITFTCEDDPDHIGQLVRSFYVSDILGNRSDTCHDTLYLEYPKIDSITMPTAYNVYCDQPYAKDPSGRPSPSLTGVPTIGASEVPLFPDNLGLLCNMSTTYTDNIILAGCNTKVMRRWQVNAWTCAGEFDSVFTQIIMVLDTTPPVVRAPGDVTLNASAGTCSANYNVPAATVTDNCGHIGVVTTYFPGGVRSQNGGFPISLPVGTHQIIYAANDGCGYSDRDTFEVTVRDLTGPNQICKGSVIVPLNNAGVGYLPAINADNGSTDNCGPLTYSIRRMSPDCNGDGDQQITFRDELEFYCCDLIENPIMVILRVTDAGGNYTECMLPVTVQNKNLPSILYNLPNITITCGTYYDPNNLSASFGKYVGNPDDRDPISLFPSGLDGLIQGICSLSIVENTPTINIGSCGVGKIIRTWTISDGVNILTPRQEITITSPAPLTSADFTGPTDVTFNNGYCSPADFLNDELGKPVLNNPANNQCRSLMYSKEDLVFSQISGACFKIIRKWTIIDWCLGTEAALANKITFSHAIVVMNTVAPNFVPHANVNVKTNRCTDTTLTVSTTATDDCATEFLSYTWQVDLFYNPGSPASWDANGNGKSLTRSFPLGTHRVAFVVYDGCGNSNSQAFNVTVTNEKRPTPVLTPLVTELMSTYMVQLNARMFNKASSAGCPFNYPLRFSFTTNPADSLKIFNCDYPIDVPFNVPIYVFDAAGNVDFATTYLTLNDNLFPCPNNTVNGINGLITTTSNIAMPDVSVSAGNVMFSATGANGYYHFTPIQPNTDYEVKPTEQRDPLNGVNAGDIIKIQNHILNRSLLDNPYKIIASDINLDKIIDSRDLIEIKKLILGKISAFSHGESWTFIDQDYQFTNPTAPLFEAFPTSIVANTNTKKDNINFQSVKYGDVDGSAVVGFSAGNIDTRSGNEIAVQINDIELQVGGKYRIDLNTDDIRLAAIQGMILYNDQFTVNSIQSQKFNVTDDDISLRSDEAKLCFTEVVNAGVHNIISLNITSNTNAKLSEILGSSTLGDALKGFDTQGEKLNINIEYVNNNKGLIVDQNVPNPFSNSTLINIYNSEQDQAILKVFDTKGQLVFKQKLSLQKGKNSVELNGSDFGASGIYFYEVVTSSGSMIKKMIKLK